MGDDPTALDVRSKMIGILLRAARLKAGKTMKESAEWLACSPHMLSQYEYGRRAISLPELELLASLYNLPVDRLWREDSTVLEDEGGKPAAGKIITLRQKVIGVLVRQARREAGKTQRQCADALGVSTDTISKYEYGKKPIPFPQLEALASYLDLPLSELLDRELPTSRIVISTKAGELMSPEDAWDRLPPRLQDFIRNPESWLYLEIALGLYELPHESLQRLAEAMLSAKETEGHTKERL